jgi:hypothetical protein
MLNQNHSPVKLALSPLPNKFISRNMNSLTQGEKRILVISAAAVSLNLGTCVNTKEVTVGSVALKRTTVQKICQINTQSLFAVYAQKLLQSECTSKDTRLFTVVNVHIFVKTVVALSPGQETLPST